MLDLKTNSSRKIKSPMGSTETLDGLTDLEVCDTTSKRKVRRGPNNLTIILIVIFISWLLVFMGFTIYQIQGYKKPKLDQTISVEVEDELDDIKPVETHVTHVIVEQLPTVEDIPSNEILEQRVDYEVPTDLPEDKVEPEVSVPAHVEELPKSVEELPKSVEEVLGPVEKPLEEVRGETVVEPKLEDTPVRVLTDPEEKTPVAKKVLPMEELIPAIPAKKEDEKIVPGSRRESITPQGIKYVKVRLASQQHKDVKRRQKRVFEKLETFMTPPKIEDTGKRFSDLTFVKQNESCYRKDFYRTNIDGKGTNMRLVAKRAKISSRESLNSGDCVTIYHWIYDNPTTKTTNIFYLGPYYGHYSVNIFESLFGKTDGKGSFRIFGCDETKDISKEAPVGGKREKIISGNVVINRSLIIFNDFQKFQEHLEKKSREEIYGNDRLFNVLKSGPNALNDFKHLSEITDCIYGI